MLHQAMNDRQEEFAAMGPDVWRVAKQIHRGLSTAWVLRVLAVVCLLPWTISVCAAQSQTKPQIFHIVHPAMGSEFSLDLYAPDQETASKWAELSFDEIDRIEALLSNYQRASELSRISREASDHEVVTDPETFGFLQAALSWSHRTGGAFDITVGPLMRAWGFFFNSGRVPSEEELERLRERTGWSKVLLQPATRGVRFQNGAKMELDPGGIGKGYAVDRVVSLLREQHVMSALLSAGSSSLYAIGAPPGAEGWRVNIPDPAQSGSTLSVVYLRDASLSTSACTEKFFIKEGHRYCHILDPKTERPVEDMLQTTVIAPTAIDTDALSTSTFVLGAEGSRKLLDAMPNAQALIVSGTATSPRYNAIHWNRPLCTSETKGSCQ